MPSADSIASTVKLLKHLPLFNALSENDLASLASHTRVDRVERDAVIFYQGDPCERVCILQQGQVKIVHHDEGGREVILEMISPGEVFGGAVLFMPRHPATSKAMQESEVVSFSSESYAQFLSAHSDVTIKLIRMLGMRLHSMMGLQVLAGERVERRVAHILLKLASRVGRPEDEGVLIPISLSRQDLAEMAGTTLETAIRTMSRFRAQKLIKTLRGGYLLITDEEALRQMANKT
jgi:CRP-like cAMP-binding protein